MFILFQVLLACKSNDKVENKQDDASISSLPSNIEWLATDIEEEFGFALFSTGSLLYASAPNSTQGTIYQLAESGRTEVISDMGRLGHQIFQFENKIYVHAPLEQRIVDLSGNILTTGQFGEIASVEEHWYAISGHSLLQDGVVLESFTKKPYSIALCNGSVGLSFPFGTHKLWVDGTWFIENDGQIDPYLHCYENTWILGGNQRILIWNGSSLEELSSEKRSFGQEILFWERPSGLEFFVSAPDADLKGWVGRYQWSNKELIQEWSGRSVNQRFGYSLALHQNSIVVSAPNPVLKDGNKSYVKILGVE